MSTPQRHSLRIVIQQIGAGRDVRYRIVGYGDKRGHAEFGSIAALRTALRAAMPDFDGTDLALHRPGGSDTFIIFAREMDMDDSQLSKLGFG